MSTEISLGSNNKRIFYFLIIIYLGLLIVLTFLLDITVTGERSFLTLKFLKTCLGV